MLVTDVLGYTSVLLSQRWNSPSPSLHALSSSGCGTARLWYLGVSSRKEISWGIACFAPCLLLCTVVARLNFKSRLCISLGNISRNANPTPLAYAIHTESMVTALCVKSWLSWEASLSTLRMYTSVARAPNESKVKNYHFSCSLIAPFPGHLRIVKTQR